MASRYLKVVLMFLCIQSCDPIQNLEVINESDETVFFLFSTNNQFDSFPIQTNIEGDTLWDLMNFLPRKEKVIAPLIGRHGWESFINKRCKDSTLTVFFFSEQLLNSSVSDSLMINQIYSKKIEFKVEDLRQLNWQINYGD